MKNAAICSLVTGWVGRNVPSFQPREIPLWDIQRISLAKTWEEGTSVNPVPPQETAGDPAAR